jgi:carbamoylphosphate synthase large subunit
MHEAQNHKICSSIVTTRSCPSVSYKLLAINIEILGIAQSKEKTKKKMNDNNVPYLLVL